MELRNIAKAYGEKQVLRRFSLRLAQGATTCLMGPSGCGKTTALRILMGLEHPDSGEVLGMEGVRLSAVFQEDRLLTRLTAAGNLRFVCASPAQEAEIAPLLAELGLGEETGATETFSGGMKRRVAIARALIATFDLLVLDEPFRGLDEETRRKTADCVRRRSAGRTLLLVTHEESDAALLGAETTVRL